MKWARCPVFYKNGAVLGWCQATVENHGFDFLAGWQTRMNEALRDWLRTHSPV